MHIRIGPFHIHFEIQNERGSRKIRRSLALMIFRALRGTFKELEIMDLQDKENKWLDFRYPFYRNYTDRHAPHVETFYQKLGFYIRTKRLKLGLTLKQLSKRTKIPLSYLSEIEHGKHRIRQTTRKKILEALEILNPGTVPAQEAQHENSSTSYDSSRTCASMD